MLVEEKQARSGSCPASRTSHTGTNLYEAGILPWDIEMTVEELLSDDEDGAPHDVSDSESESEDDSD
jgi:hypothetical protein